MFVFNSPGFLIYASIGFALIDSELSFKYLSYLFNFLLVIMSLIFYLLGPNETSPVLLYVLVVLIQFC